MLRVASRGEGPLGLEKPVGQAEGACLDLCVSDAVLRWGCHVANGRPARMDVRGGTRARSWRIAAEPAALGNGVDGHSRVSGGYPGVHLWVRQALSGPL